MAGAKPARLTLAWRRERRVESGRKCLVWIPANVLMQVARGKGHPEAFIYFAGNKITAVNINVLYLYLRREMLV
jgi:hypothetical protein